MSQPAREDGLVLVTGASSGIGLEFARAFASRGRNLVLVARRRERLEALAEELRAAHGVRSTVVVADLSEPDVHTRVLAEARAEGDWIQTLVNNAGYGVAQDFVHTPWDRQRDFLMTLVVSACGLTHEVLPEMLERGSGAIINVASLAGFAPGGAGYTLYPAAKSFAIRFSQSLHAEVGDKGVRVTAVCPGFTRTEFAEAAGATAQLDQAPRRFWQSAEEVVAISLRANDRGRIVVVPGLHNKIAAAALRYLPDGFTRAAIARAGAKYRVSHRKGAA